MTSTSAGAYKEFKVVFDGIELPADAVDRIDQAIRKAVTDELARAQIATTSVRPLREELGEQEGVYTGGGMTDGIRVQ